MRGWGHATAHFSKQIRDQSHTVTFPFLINNQELYAKPPFIATYTVSNIEHSDKQLSVFM